MHTHLALLRGINVGGKSLIKMAELKEALATTGLKDVSTYIQSGNVIFSTNSTNTNELASLINKAILEHFALKVAVAAFSKEQWTRIVQKAPKWWGADSQRKHNLIVMIEPYDMTDVVAAIGALKPDIERLEPGEGVLYQSLSIELFGRTTSGKLASKPIYKKMTIRNYNTAHKLVSLIND